MRQAGLVPEQTVLFGTSSGSGRGSTDREFNPVIIEDLFVPDLNETAETTLGTIPTTLSKSSEASVSSLEISSLMDVADGSVVIYSGFGGQLVPSEICDRFRVLHLHAGWLPEFAGSTTIYYSILTDEGCAVTALLLNKDIDAGETLMKLKYPSPPPGVDIDYVYDSALRADLLVRVLRHYNKTGDLPIPQEQDTAQRRIHYIIHPLLKNIAISKVNGLPE